MINYMQMLFQLHYKREHGKKLFGEKGCYFFNLKKAQFSIFGNSKSFVQEERTRSSSNFHEIRRWLWPINGGKFKETEHKNRLLRFEKRMIPIFQLIRTFDMYKLFEKLMNWTIDGPSQKHY